MLSWFRRTFELETSQRLVPMEGLRGAAVLLVFLHHYMTQSMELFAPTATFSRWFSSAMQRYGNLGVELFFVLSGYLIYGILISKRPTFYHFISRRVVRIYPAFLLALAVAISADLILSGGKIPKSLWSSIPYVSANLLLLPGVFPINPILTVAWSLSYEFFFYFTTALVVLSLPTRRISPRYRISTICCLGLAFCVLFLAGLPVPIRMLPFFAGMLLFELLSLRRFSVGPIAIMAPISAFFAGEFLPLPPLVREAAHTCAFLLLCYACFRESTLAAKIFSWSPLRWLGNMSFSYYLFHGFAVVAAAKAFSKSPLPTDFIFWLGLPLAFAVTLVPSAVVFIFVEKPISLGSNRQKGHVPPVDSHVSITQPTSP